MWAGISRDTGLTRENYATIVSVFMVAYAVGQALSGRLFDRVGTRLGFALCAVVWTCAVCLVSAARGAFQLGSSRALLGASESGNWPGAAKANAEWFPRQERALAQGIFNAGASLGGVISAPLVAYLYVRFGWRATYLVMGGAAVLWLIPWWIFARATPARHPWVSEAERAHILGDEGRAEAAAAGPAGAGPGMSWGRALSRPQTWAIVGARFFLDPVWWLFVNWLPIILLDRFGFDVKQIGAFGWIPYAGAVVGSLGGGWYSGHLIRRGRTTDRARKQAIVVGGAMAIPGFLIAALVSHPLPAVMAMGLVLCGFQVMINNVQTLPSDYYSGRSVGTVAGIGGLGAVAGVLAFSTWLVPFLSRISYVPIFVLGAALVPLGIASVFVLGGPIRRVDA
jgi:ACS family hexuronate transporter-like MFS transporter